MTRARRVLTAIALGLVCLSLPGCATLGFYAQAVRGHLDLMGRARPIAEVIDDPATSPRLKSQLALALEIRNFAARELDLPDNDSYRWFADLERPFVVWNVFAAPEFSLEPRRWCFPFAGCVAYRGYFAQAAAERTGAHLREQGYQAYVGGVPAYSTLGWFADPVLNTFVGYPQYELARLIFHELAHQRFYLAGDTMFNESFAVAVEREGVRRWLTARGSPETIAGFERAQARRESFLKLLLEHRAALAALYRSGLEPPEMRARRAVLRDEMRQRFAAFRLTWAEADQPFAGFDRWFGDGPDNARLVAVALYSDHVPAFEALLAQQGGDLRRFHEAVQALAALPEWQRREQLRSLSPP